MLIHKTVFNFIWDGSAVKFIPCEVLELLQDAGVYDSSQAFVSFCGIVSFDDNVFVFLPKNHPKPLDFEERLVARTILECVNKYYKDRRSENTFNEREELAGKPERLSIYKEIIQDYRRNGLYRSSEKQSRRSRSGKINWKTTIKRTLPVYSKDGVPIYPSYITSKFLQSSNNLVALVHAAIVSEIDTRFGWWFSDGEHELTAPELRGSSFPNKDKAMLAAALKLELSGVFIDRQVRLLKNLISYLDESSSLADFGDRVVGVKRFEYVWERMIEYSVGPSSLMIKEALSSPVYVDIHKNTTLVRSKSGRIDTVIHEGDAIAIIDAKYYRVSGVSSAPGWPDLVKQFFYERLVTAAFKSAVVGNFFILPRASEAPSLVVAGVGHSVSEAVVELDQIFPPIGLIYLCPKEIISDYNRGVRNKMLRRNIIAFTSILKSKDHGDKVSVLHDKLSGF